MKILLLFLIQSLCSLFVSVLALPSLGKEDFYCLQLDMLLYNGSCYPPLSSKPCSNPQTSQFSQPSTSWLVLSKDSSSGSLRSICSPRSDSNPNLQSCSHPRFDVFGDFSCDCKGSKSKFVLRRRGSRACSPSSSQPPCPVELQEALQSVCSGIESRVCCMTELIGSCEDFQGRSSPKVDICSEGAELSTFYFNLTGSYFHDYHDFYKKESGFGDYFAATGGSAPEDFFSSGFLNDTQGHLFGGQEERIGLSVCPDGTPYPSDCPLQVCCPDNEIRMEIEMDFCEKSGYVWNKGLRECLPKLFLGPKGRLLDYVATKNN